MIILKKFIKEMEEIKTDKNFIKKFKEDSDRLLEKMNKYKDEEKNDHILKIYKSYRIYKEAYERELKKKKVSYNIDEEMKNKEEILKVRYNNKTENLKKNFVKFGEEVKRKLKEKIEDDEKFLAKYS